MWRARRTASARRALRALGLAALWLVAAPRVATSRVADTDLANLVATADVIVLDTDRVPDADLTIRFSGSEGAFPGERLKRLPLAFRIPANG